MNKFDCIIVGSGINALVCAALLSKQGNKVLVLERNDRLGGCIRTDEITAPGFVHDVLSSWHPLFVTSPGYAELKDDLEKYGLEYCNTDSPTAVVLPDQTSFVLRNSREENISAMNALAGGDGDRYGAAMAELEQSLGLTFTLLGSEFVARRHTEGFTVNHGEDGAVQTGAVFRRRAAAGARLAGHDVQFERDQRLPGRLAVPCRYRSGCACLRVDGAGDCIHPGDGGLSGSQGRELQHRTGLSAGD